MEVSRAGGRLADGDAGVLRLLSRRVPPRGGVANDNVAHPVGATHDVAADGSESQGDGVVRVVRVLRGTLEGGREGQRHIRARRADSTEHIGTRTIKRAAPERGVASLRRRAAIRPQSL
jgi:hypothetical protein